jgi:hypothetical protein
MKLIDRPLRFSFLCLTVGLTTLSSPAQTPPAPAAPAAASAPVLDYGDYSSATLTGKAWAALESKNYPAVLGYTNKCIDMFKAQAVQMQGTLKAPAPKEKANDYWALNDVGTCYFIKAKALDDQGNKKDAIAAYKFLADNLSFAQCWDPKGWFWAPADGARKRVAELQFDAAQ